MRGERRESGKKGRATCARRKENRGLEGGSMEAKPPPTPSGKRAFQTSCREWNGRWVYLELTQPECQACHALHHSNSGWPSTWKESSLFHNTGAYRHRGLALHIPFSFCPSKLLTMQNLPFSWFLFLQAHRTSSQPQTRETTHFLGGEQTNPSA